ncbi:MAG TPA: spore coat U domain-containing protein [Vicinamibacterales bacterium]
MSRQTRRLLAGTGATLAILAGAYFTQPVSAATSTANLAVSATVTANCLVQAGSIDFGSYDPVVANETAPLDEVGSFQVRCTKGASAVLKLSSGANPSGGARRMSSGGTDFLAYELYSDAGRTTVWDEANTVTYNAASSAVADIDVFGRIPPGQDVGAGNYSDTVTITAEF